jgi:hypothetical protein
MRSIFFTVLFFTAFLGSLQAQQLLNFLDRTGNGVLERNRLEKKDNKITGSPYVNEKFMPADIEGAEVLVLVRYNPQSDEVEIAYEDKILILPKRKEFSQVALKSGQNILLLNYVDVRESNIYGYLFELNPNSKTSLYLRQRAIIIPEREPQNSYENYSPARYSNQDNEYYFIYKNEIVSFPSKKKDLVNMFPDKKKEIENFLKINKLKFKDQEDLIKIATYLDSL